MNTDEIDGIVYTSGGGGSGGFWMYAKKALSTFLGLPLAIVLLFIIGAVTVAWLDQSAIGFVQQLRQTISRYVFKTSDASGAVLGLIATGLLTMTSLVISMLLIALQQTAGNMGNLVYDQFMKRRRNQIYAGYIVGTVVFAFLLRPTTSDTFNPILAATTSTIAAVIGIILLLYFLYSTINQMRPQTIVDSIHDEALRARQRQAKLMQRTRRVALLHSADFFVALRTDTNGYVVDIDGGKLAAIFAEITAPVEVEARVTIGAHVACHDLLALVKANDFDLACDLARQIGKAYMIGSQREGETDPKFELEQLEMIAWTEMSTAKENPETGLMAIHALRDLLARWTGNHAGQNEENTTAAAISFVYPDAVLPAALSTFESLAVISAESKQHLTMSAILLSIALLLPHLPDDLQTRSEELIVRVLPTLDQHGLTRELDYALAHLAASLDAVNGDETAQMVRDARQTQADKLPRSVSPPAPSPILFGRPGLSTDDTDQAPSS